MLKQRLAPTLAHGHAGRALIGRCAIQVIAAGQRRGYLHSLLIDGQRQHLRTFVGKRITRVPKTGFFNPDHGAAAGKQTGQQVKALLAAQSQQHLIMGGGNSASRQYPADQLVDQLAGADAFTFLPPAIHRLHFQCLTAALTPLRERKLFRVELPVNKRVTHVPPAWRALGPHDLRIAGQHAGRPVRWLTMLVGIGLGILRRGDGPAHEEPIAGARVHITFRHQAFIHQHRSVARNAGQHGQVAARRQPRAAGQTAFQHGCDEGGAQLHLQGFIVLAHGGQQLAPHQIMLACAHKNP